MDRQKKRKRTVNTDANSGDHSGGAAVSPPLPAPSEAEVDEFFAILRRMNVAVKYLQKNAQIDDVAEAGGQKRVDLDLNTLPESED
ncbi:hypothetical protein BC332_09436 [Capsicum chinense]|nr:hypothetical protein BC332_09436 [Capsicum chinense]